MPATYFRCSKCQSILTPPPRGVKKVECPDCGHVNVYMTKRDAARQWRKEITGGSGSFAWLNPDAADADRRMKRASPTTRVGGGGVLLLIAVGFAIYWFGFHSTKQAEDTAGRQFPAASPGVEGADRAVPPQPSIPASEPAPEPLVSQLESRQTDIQPLEPVPQQELSPVTGEPISNNEPLEQDDLSLMTDADAEPASPQPEQPDPGAVEEEPLVVVWMPEWPTTQPSDHPFQSTTDVMRQIERGQVSATVGVMFGAPAQTTDDASYLRFKNEMVEGFAEAVRSSGGTIAISDKSREINGIMFDYYMASRGSRHIRLLIGIQDGRCVCYWYTGPSTLFKLFMGAVGKARFG